MQKRFKLLTILFTLVFSFLTATVRISPSTARATYVEGPILQDTVWTLVDSPFVVSGDITIFWNATLTIEPGVEVRFGEDFMLTVEGRLVANGTAEQMIKFTSNKAQPEAGDWQTVTFAGSLPSSLIYCLTEYGTNGIALGSGLLTVQHSQISNNSETGIAITGGQITISDSRVTGNTLSGIHVSGGTLVVVQDNTVEANGNGITLIGDLLGDIDIRQNQILQNTQSGILLSATTYANTAILNNTLSANHYGFYVLASTTTQITRNYITGNDFGIFYEQGSHTASFNDIYDNEIGMDVSASASVNATYNYWGARTGPLHQSLNPRGRGNPVGGDGLNLDFIFYLTFPIDYANGVPTAVLWPDKSTVAPNQNVTFIGTNSFDDGRIDQYLFEFGDGFASNWTTLSLFTYSYSSVGVYVARLQVMDDFGVKSFFTTTTINVTSVSSLDAQVSLSESQVDSNDDVSIVAYVSDGLNPVENATVTMFAAGGGSFAPGTGLTNATGHFTIVFTAPNVTDITSCRINVRASKDGFADGSDYEYLTVFPPLVVQVSAEPSTVKSEGTSTVTVYASSGFEEPVGDASLTLWSDIGTLSATAGTTNSDGNAQFTFTSPETTEALSANIHVTATKPGYVSGDGQTTITILPKVLEVQVTADSSSLISEERTNVTVQVTHEGAPVADANVTIVSSAGGNFSVTSAFTDLNGEMALIFTAPPVNTMTNAILTAHASKAKYADGQGTLNIPLQPGLLQIDVGPNPDAVMSRESSIVTVNVTCDSEPAAFATVTVSANIGNFSTTGGVTDENGHCTFIFTAPVTATQLQATITANASKNGFISAENQAVVTVTPETVAQEQGGWPLTTMLLIIIPVVIAMIIVVLVKLKVITFSEREEE